MSKNNGIIGLFDSGIGGLTVLSEIVKELPQESYIYYGDGKSLPLGEKSEDEIINITDKAVAYLIEHGAKIIVLACNTATAAAKDYLRSKYDIDIIAIEPAVKPAATTTKKGSIGIIATKSTITGDPLKKLCNIWGKECKIITRIGSGLVEIVEKDEQPNEDDLNLIKSHIDYLVGLDVDKIVLGCTHYPFLSKEITQLIGSQDIELINPAPFVAKRVVDVLKSKNLLSNTNNNLKIEFASSLDNSYIELIKKKYNFLNSLNNKYC